MSPATDAATGRRESDLRSARDGGRKLLAPYVTGGLPGWERTVEACAAAGADAIEVGIPFSDPVMDGPTIQEASERALAAGATPQDIVGAMGAIETGGVPLVVMTYYNTVHRYGHERFAASLAAAGVAGAIVPDLPLEEAGEIGAELSGARIALVPLVAPTTPDVRRRQICQRAEGFVYVVSDTKVTGERDRLPDGLAELVAAVRADAAVPAAVGFGIGTPEQAAAVGRIADGVIIGSRLVRAVSEADGMAPAVEAVSRFIHATRQALADGGRAVE